MPRIASYEAGTPSWLDLVTSDPAGAREFYGGLFGWEFRIGPPETGFYTYCLVDGVAAAGLVGQPRPDAPAVWTTYLATHDVDETAERMSDAGGTVLMGPMEVGPAGSVVVAQDPTGATVGAWEGAAHPGAEVVNEPGAMVWNELVTTDLAVAADFYSKVFGYGWDDEDTGDGGPRYRTFSVGGQVVGGAMELDAILTPQVPPHWMPYFAVPDTDAAAARAAALGGAVQSEPADSPYGRWCVLRDPQGGIFTVMRPPEDAPPL